MTTEEKIEVMQAWLALSVRKIERRPHGDEAAPWYAVYGDIEWNWGVYDYRLCEPPKPLDVWCNVDKDGDATYHPTKAAAEDWAVNWMRGTAKRVAVHLVEVPAESDPDISPEV
jgi:hypothetical protein